MSALARQLADKLGKSQKYALLMGELIKIALLPCASDLRAFGEAPDATEASRGILFSQVAAGEEVFSRMLTADQPPRTQMPKPARPQFPESCIE